MLLALILVTSKALEAIIQFASSLYLKMVMRWQKLYRSLPILVAKFDLVL